MTKATKASAMPSSTAAKVAALVRTLRDGVPEIDAVIVLLTRTPITVDTAKVAHQLLSISIHDCVTGCGYVDTEQGALLNLLKEHLYDDCGIAFEGGGWRNFRGEAS